MSEACQPGWMRCFINLPQVPPQPLGYPYRPSCPETRSEQSGGQADIDLWRDEHSNILQQIYIANCPVHADEHRQNWSDWRLPLDWWPGPQQDKWRQSDATCEGGSPWDMHNFSEWETQGFLLRPPSSFLYLDRCISLQLHAYLFELVFNIFKWSEAF